MGESGWHQVDDGRTAGGQTAGGGPGLAPEKTERGSKWARNRGGSRQGERLALGGRQRVGVRWTAGHGRGPALEKTRQRRRLAHSPASARSLAQSRHHDFLFLALF